MKINSIHTAYNKTTNRYNTNFKRTAVPYPEYRSAYIVSCKKASGIESIVNKISDFFSPEVTTEAKHIQRHIDKAYAEAIKNVKPNKHTKDAKQALLTVLA